MNNLLGKHPLNLPVVGNIYQLGQHRLLCGDATNQEQVQALLEHESVDLLLTDPPYGIGYVENKEAFTGSTKHKKIVNDQEQSEREFEEFTTKWLKLVEPHMASKNSVYIFHADAMIWAMRNAMNAAGFKYKQMLIWLKTAAVIGRLDYLPQHELCAYGWSGAHKFYKGKDKNILIHPRPAKSKLHPTMKPVGLLRRLILNSSKVSDTIYDPFGGSGSCLLAAEQTKRRCLMIEQDPEYCQVILNRFTKATNCTPQLLTTIS